MIQTTTGETAVVLVDIDLFFRRQTILLFDRLKVSDRFLQLQQSLNSASSYPRSSSDRRQTDFMPVGRLLGI